MIILMQVAKKVLMEGYRSITSDDFVNLQSNLQCQPRVLVLFFPFESKLYLNMKNIQLTTAQADYLKCR